MKNKVKSKRKYNNFKIFKPKNNKKDRSIKKKGGSNPNTVSILDEIFNKITNKYLEKRKSNNDNSIKVLDDVSLKTLKTLISTFPDIVRSHTDSKYKSTILKALVLR